MTDHWQLSADTGGTFTDFIARGPDGKVRRGKVLSSGKIRTSVIRAEESVIKINPLPLADPGWLLSKPVWIDGRSVGLIREITQDSLTVSGTGAVPAKGSIVEIDTGLEAPVLAMRMVTPEAPVSEAGLSLRLGTTKGTNALLERTVAPVALFLTRGFGDLLRIRDQKRPHLFTRKIAREDPLYHRVYEIPGRISTAGEELDPIGLDTLKKAAREALDHGCTVAAVCFLNSWRNSIHEDQARDFLRDAGFERINLSSEIRPLIKYLDRADTVLVNALLDPILDEYLDRVGSEIRGNPLWIMTSAGGLVSRSRFHAVDSLVSGPAGGVLGAVEAGFRAGMDKIIGLDMGGTSTDVSRWKSRLELRQQVTVGEASILSPALPIETVAAGGGSICGFRDGRLHVGPMSAGADPGPACYGAGGPLCLTDIHLLLGRLNPDAFSIPIRIEDARKRLEEVMKAAGESDWRALAEGFLAIATERMAHAIHQVTLRDGEDPRGYCLVAFGGAGGLQACRVADQLGINRILFPGDAGLLSARGIQHASREVVRDKQVFMALQDANPPLPGEFERILADAMESLLADGVSEDQIGEPVHTVFIRIVGQETGIPVQWKSGKSLEAGFKKQFKAIYGYYPDDPSLEIIKLQVRLSEKHRHEQSISFSESTTSGPHVISDAFATCYVESGWRARKGDDGSYLLEKIDQEVLQTTEVLENVRRTLVMNRLEGLVEEMGEQLRRTSLSTNIRERLDFSCALLDREGRLLVNAPHIPVHLGAMGLCVRECMRQLEIGPGDVIITNHPAFGGSHLPDVTLACGLFDSSGNRIGFLANRAHHAEWGGSAPGSMPADATALIHEGVIVSPQYLLKNGCDRFKEIEDLLSSGAFPTRAPRENRIDLEAQLAALHRGVDLFTTLLNEYGAGTVTKYFRSFYDTAAQAMMDLLHRYPQLDQETEELLDDGHVIKVRIFRDEEWLAVDFSGTSPVHPGNLNATPAIVRSAVLYVLRMWVERQMPLNEGLLDRVRIHLPTCFLNPDFPADPQHCPAVVGGNVETSQRVVDTLIRCLGLMAAGQGTMNNLIFGNEDFSYYETIGGGSGAGEGFDGASGVHVHMTNTAITDPEILEQRFPVFCREFSLRENSGGKGKWAGGDGLVREIQFQQPVSVSLLTQNRNKGPRGMQGGEDGMAGCQFRVLVDGTRLSLDGIAQVNLAQGESIRIETPGGGGFKSR